MQPEAITTAIANADAQLNNVAMPNWSDLANIIKSLDKAGLLDPELLGNTAMKAAREAARKAAVQLSTLTLKADYTDLYDASCDTCSFNILVKPGTDMDGTFTAWDVQEDKPVVLRGWLWRFGKPVTMPGGWTFVEA